MYVKIWSNIMYVNNSSISSLNLTTGATVISENKYDFDVINTHITHTHK